MAGGLIRAGFLRSYQFLVNFPELSLPCAHLLPCQRTKGCTLPAWQLPWQVVSVQFGAELCVVGVFPVIACPCPQVAVCNLASIALNMYVTPEHIYDFKRLAEVTKVIVRNLNKIIDINYYPVPEVSAGLGWGWVLPRAIPEQAGTQGVTHRPAGSSVNHLFQGGTCQCLPELQPAAVL